MKRTLFTLKTFINDHPILNKKCIHYSLFFALGFFLLDPIFAGVEGDMQASVTGLQKEIFGAGWVTVGKIAAAATGIVMSVAKMNMIPFVIGGLSSGGIHFFQKYTEAAVSCIF